MPTSRRRSIPFIQANGVEASSEELEERFLTFLTIGLDCFFSTSFFVEEHAELLLEVDVLELEDPLEELELELELDEDLGSGALFLVADLSETLL